MKQNMKRGIDYIGVGVGALMVDSEDRLFLSRRGPQAKNERGLWEFPGGSVEFGKQMVEVRRMTFTQWGGFYLETYTLSRSMPHTIQDVREKNLVLYDCGVMF
jgi:hypothetical protein